eukprot:Skav236792  [mRNA]  locus=scaffold1361:414131:424079:- [translate_table: standard]
MGTVKFLGSTEFAAGEWLGIELDEQAGKNDGSVKGKRYFESKPEHGIFVRPTAATKVDTATAAVLQPPSVSVAQVVSPVEEIVPPCPGGSGGHVRHVPAAVPSLASTRSKNFFFA